MPEQVPTLHPSVLLTSLVILAWIFTSQISLLIYLLKRGSLWPESPPRPVVWNSRGVLGVLLLWIGLQLVGSTVMSLSTTSGQPTRLGYREMMILSGLVNLALVVLGPILLAWSARVPVTELDLLGPEPLLNLNRGIGSWPILTPWIYSIYFAAQQIWTTTKHPLEEWVRADRSWGTIIASSMTAVVLAPIAEEFLFRGVLLGWLTKLTLSNKPDPVVELSERENLELVGESMPIKKPMLRFWLANLITSSLFATMHWQVWPSPIPIFLLSLGLGILYQRTGGLAAPIGLHVTFNGITTLLLHLTLIGVESKPLVVDKVPASIVLQSKSPPSATLGHVLEKNR